MDTRRVSYSVVATDWRWQQRNTRLSTNLFYFSAFSFRKRRRKAMRRTKMARAPRKTTTRKMKKRRRKRMTEPSGENHLWCRDGIDDEEDAMTNAVSGNLNQRHLSSSVFTLIYDVWLHDFGMTATSFSSPCVRVCFFLLKLSFCVPFAGMWRNWRTYSDIRCSCFFY